MAKVKIYQLAKELNISSASLLQVCKLEGYDLKSHMSSIDEEACEKIKKKLVENREKVKEEYLRKNKKVKEKSAVSEEKKVNKAEEEKKTKKYTNFAALAGKTKDKKKKRRHGKVVDKVQVKENVRKIMATIDVSDKTKKKYKRDSDNDTEGDNEEKKKLVVSEFVSVGELAKMMELSVSEVMGKCLGLGMMITINQRLDFDTISLLADEFGFEAELMEEYKDERIGQIDISESENLELRNPIVTVMGHVDHGKTSLLDYIRKENVISGEAGGITQHIGAYIVKTKKGDVTFLDTPGHEAFTAMRSRGAQLTDVVVLVIAADSGIMPQTKEAIDHAKAAGVPIVVAINKIDLPEANVDKIKGQLAENNVLVEEFGGEVQAVPVSAKTGENVDKLLELLAIESEMLELKADKQVRASGVIVESELNKGMGASATVLILNGTLRIGEPFVVGVNSGKVRTMTNSVGKAIKEAGPATPVVVTGMDGVPQAGDTFNVVESERDARDIASKRRQAKHERDIRRYTVTLDNWKSQVDDKQKSELLILIKGDVDGSVEALATQFEQLATDEVRVHVIHKSVGAIKETDINLAAASNAIIVGFHVRPNSKMLAYAKSEGVEIRLYKVIYEAIEEVKKAMGGLLAPIEKEKVTGRAQIRELFKVSKLGNIAGCVVISGSIKRNNMVRIIRDEVEVFSTTIASLRRIKEDVKEVLNGLECGIVLEKFNDIKVDDIIEAYEIEKIERTL